MHEKRGKNVIFRWALQCFKILCEVCTWAAVFLYFSAMALMAGSSNSEGSSDFALQFQYIVQRAHIIYNLVFCWQLKGDKWSQRSAKSTNIALLWRWAAVKTVQPSMPLYVDFQSKFSAHNNELCGTKQNETKQAKCWMSNWRPNTIHKLQKTKRNNSHKSKPTTKIRETDWQILNWTDIQPNMTHFVAVWWHKTFKNFKSFHMSLV